jgi:hypothetical protein
MLRRSFCLRVSGAVAPSAPDGSDLSRDSRCYFIVNQGAAKFLEAFSTSGRKAFLGVFMQPETAFFVTDLYVA